MLRSVPFYVVQPPNFSRCVRGCVHRASAREPLPPTPCNWVGVLGENARGCHKQPFHSTTAIRSPCVWPGLVLAMASTAARSGPRRREVERSRSPPRRPLRVQGPLRCVELGYVLWTPQSVELRTERHRGPGVTFEYRLYASVVFHGLYGTDGDGVRYVWPHACRRRNRRGELLPPHVTVIRELEATAEEIDHLRDILSHTMGFIEGAVYTSPSEFAFMMEAAGVDPLVRTFTAQSPLFYMLGQLRYEIYHWLLRRGFDADRAVHLPDAHLWL